LADQGFEKYKAALYRKHLECLEANEAKEKMTLLSAEVHVVFLLKNLNDSPLLKVLMSISVPCP
jgi:hypothetical protein